MGAERTIGFIDFNSAENNQDPVEEECQGASSYQQELQQAIETGIQNADLDVFQASFVEIMGLAANNQMDVENRNNALGFLYSKLLQFKKRGFISNSPIFYSEDVTDDYKRVFINEEYEKIRGLIRKIEQIIQITKMPEFEVREIEEDAASEEMQGANVDPNVIGSDQGSGNNKSSKKET